MPHNVFLAAVVPLMAMRHAAVSTATTTSVARGGAHIAAAVPAFVAGFVAMAGMRTAGDYQLEAGEPALGFLDKREWKEGVDWLGGVLETKVCLGTGLAAVGLSVRFETFKTVGLRPFIVGATGTAIVGGVGLNVALLASQLKSRPM